MMMMMMRSSLVLSRTTLLQHCRKFRAPREPPVPKRNSTIGIVGKSATFAAGTTLALYGGATIWHLEVAHTGREPSRHQFETIKGDPGGSPTEGLLNLKIWWQNQSSGDKQFYLILAANAAVLAMWKVPRLTKFMTTYFAHSPTSNKVSPMFLSMFSHRSFIHFACNMYVLNSFIWPSEMMMGSEQLFATYVTAGLTSSLASLCFKRFIGLNVQSLGASGAILGMVGFVCAAQPDALIHIVLLPMFTFSAANAIKALIAFDALGLVMRWKFLDHAAHIGGALYGIAYFHEGQKFYAWYSQKIYELWLRIRSNPGK